MPIATCLNGSWSVVNCKGREGVGFISKNNNQPARACGRHKYKQSAVRGGGGRSGKEEEGEGEGKVRLLLSILRRCNCGVWFDSNATINPWGRGDINNQCAWARMRMRTRRRKYPPPPHPSILQHRNRSEVETAAARGPARTVCKYDIVTDAITTEEDSHNQYAYRRDMTTLLG